MGVSKADRLRVILIAPNASHHLKRVAATPPSHKSGSDATAAMSDIDMLDAARSALSITDLRIFRVGDDEENASPTSLARPERCSFRLHGASDALASAIRRTLLRDVPSIAVYQVEVLENNTPFPDDFIAHRIGLTPIAHGGCSRSNGCRLLNSPRFVDEAKCVCLADPIFEVRVKGPGQLFSHDFSCTSQPVAKAPAFVPGVVVCVLGEGQCLHLRAMANVGTGSTHARYIPCAAPSYARRRAGVEYAECLCADLGANDEAPPPGERCKRCGSRRAAAALLGEPFTHTFRFESTGASPTLSLLLTALHVLESKLTSLQRAVFLPE